MAIIDLATGDQPMVDPDTGNIIVFNGEIYNYVEVRDALKLKGHRFRTESDTEVLLKAYADYGLDMFVHLNGMFAFAIYDEKAQSSILARDRFGEKPLFYFLTDGRLTFASELSALQRTLAFPDEPDPLAAAEYLAFGYVSGARTMFKHVRQLLLGHLLRFSRDGAQDVEYWRLPATGDDSPPADSEFERSLRDAIALRLRADVPVATLLSGGVDSSLITLVAQQASARPLKENSRVG